ncbi:MAG TPA: 4-carboxy-4-hydroxy-2-oxoadipate aldolase/oxaloacetate decarboxylase [Candidatus Acidoferrales bacterium]|nr:4-carboxy-4-hydroxy-2-oxoadipate aldolase/oxaloacetate decarboxylase [Candidatus Acidoferrales bacterium]
MKMGTVVRNIPRADPSVVDSLRQCGVATVHEAMERTGLMMPYMRPIYPSARAAGSAITVLTHPGDNWMIHVAVEHCQPGDLLVIAISSECSDGFFGELLATSYKAHGVCGLVLDAGCRDVAELARMQFPVWSRVICAKGTTKASLGCVNVPVVCAGAVVNPGDIVVADDDGVVVVPHRGAQDVATAALKRVTKEEAKRARLASGELNLDLENMRGKLSAAGLMYYDTIEEAVSRQEKQML